MSAAAQDREVSLGPRERGKRLRLGWIGGGLFVAVAAAVLVLDAPRVVRLAALGPALLATLGFLQYRGAT